MHPSKPTNHEVMRWVHDNHEMFELMVIGACMRDTMIASQCAPYLCRDRSRPDAFVDDFSKPIYFVVYRAVLEYQALRMRIPSAADWPMISLQTAEPIIRTLANNGEGIFPEEADLAVQCFMHIQGNFLRDDSLAVVKACLGDWLASKRLSRLGKLTRQKHLTKERVEEELQEIRQIEGAGQSGIKTVSFANSLIIPDDSQLERIPTGFPPLDRAYGRGWAKKEAYLVIAGQGVGKTVCGLQFASHMAASSRKRIIYITTEQESMELSPRIIACNCRIPFDLIKDGVVMSALQPDQIQEVHRFAPLLDEQHWQYVEWTTDRNRAVHANLDAIVNECGAKMGGVDAIFLDWVGGSLAAGVTDPQQLRLRYQEAGDGLCLFCRKYNMLGVAFAQAAPMKAYNNMRIDATAIAECKSLGNNFTGVVGMTGLLNAFQDDGDIGDNLVFRDEQFFYNSKARKSPPQPVPFKRNYRYQQIAVR